MGRKGILLGLSFLSALALWMLGTGTIFAGKPSSTPVTVTFRTGQEATDGVHGDGLGAYDNGSIDNGQLNLGWGSGREVYYNLSNPDFTCLAGQPGLFHGGGNLRVSPDDLAFLLMGAGTSQSGYATYNIAVGKANYLLRFRAVDDLSVQPPANCSTQVTITRTAAGISSSGAPTGTWTVEADSSDIARLLSNNTRGPGFTNLGHYKATFLLTVQTK